MYKSYKPYYSYNPYNIYKYLRILFIVALTISLLSLTGCSTTQKLIRHGKLEVETKMSASIFLDPLEEKKKTVLLQIRNTSDKSGLDIKSQVKSALIGKGYKIVNSPSKANIMIQVNILQVGKARDDDPFKGLTGGYGAGFEGIAVGAALSNVMGSSGKGMLGAGLAAGALGFVLDAAVEVVNFSMTTDLQISEKAIGSFVSESSDASLKQGTSGSKKSTWKQKTNWKKYQTRIMSVASKVNLKFEEAEPELTEGLVKAISGLL